MAKRSKTQLSSEVGIDIVQEVYYTEREQSVLVVNKFPAMVKKTGQATGKLYVWTEAGAIVEVAKSDVAELLTHKVGESSCCGSNSKGNLLFEVV